MSPSLSAVLQEAEVWLASQPSPGPSETKMFRKFVSTAKVGPSGPSLLAAIHALRRGLVDSSEWNSESFKTISQFLSRVERVAKGHHQ